MRIIVAIKQILDPQGITVRRDKERVFVNREEYIIDPASKAAIEAALRLKDATSQAGEPEPTVIAISMGEIRAEDALREALAMGCDEAQLLSDQAFKDSDSAVATRVLAAAVERIGGAELLIVGRESGDTGSGQIGPRLAEALGWAQVTDVFALTAATGTLHVIRRWSDRYAAVAIPVPAVISVARQAFPPRYPHGARIMSAYREWQVPVWNAVDLGLEDADLVPVLTYRGQSFPPPLETGELLRGDPVRVAHEVVMALKLQRFIQ